MTDPGETRPTAGPSDTEIAELTRLGARFRTHHIFFDITRERGLRYRAHGAVAGAHPHTVITHDLAELRHELKKGTQRE